MNKNDITKFAQNLLEAADMLEDGHKEALALTLKELKAEAIKQSSGTLSLDQLRSLDHPYARRHRVMRLDPDMVNEQSGEFKRGWRVEGPVMRNGEWTGFLYNEDEKSDLYLEPGTATMVPRNPQGVAQAKIQPRHDKRIEELIAKVTAKAKGES